MGHIAKGLAACAQCQPTAVQWEGSHCHSLRSPNFPRKANAADLYVKSHKVSFFIDTLQAKLNAAPWNPQGYVWSLFDSWTKLESLSLQKWKLVCVDGQIGKCGGKKNSTCSPEDATKIIPSQINSFPMLHTFSINSKHDHSHSRCKEQTKLINNEHINLLSTV